MAWDLWSSTYDQVLHDSNYSEHFGWHCDFYFGWGRDVIEEDALNEKYCIQVLRKLITKEDTEIEELERDLLSLQNELARAEHQNWPETGRSALTEKINCLDVLIGRLKNDHADNTGIQLRLNNEPVETLNEIVKATQRNHCQDKCGQPPDVNVNILNPSMIVSKHPIDKESRDISRNILIKEEQNEVCGTSENSTSSKHPLEPHKRSDIPVKIETANTNVKDSSPGSPKFAAGDSKEEKILAVYYSGGTEEEETKEDVFDAEDRSLTENIVMCPEEERCNPKADKELLAKTVVTSADLGAIICSPGPSYRMNVLGTSDLKVLANEEVRRSQLVTTVTGQILNSFSSTGKQEDATVKDITADAFGLVAGSERRKKCLDVKLHASQQAKSENSDLDQKLCDFASKAARRDCQKESKVTLTQDVDPNLPSNRDCKRTTAVLKDTTREFYLADPELWNGKNSSHATNIQGPSLVNAKNSGLSPLLEIQTKSALLTGSQLTDEGKSRALCLQNETTANLSKSVLSKPVEPKNQGKRKVEPDSFFAREPGDGPMEVISNSSLKVTTKRQRKTRTSIDGANSTESLNRKVAERTVQPGQHETEEYAIVPYDSKFSELQKKRNVSKLPITVGIQKLIVNSEGVAMNNGNHEDLRISRMCSSVDSPNETSALLPISLENLPLRNLRAIAKQHNVKKYYRLAKGPLVEQLTQLLSSC